MADRKRKLWSYLLFLAIGLIIWIIFSGIITLIIIAFTDYLFNPSPPQGFSQPSRGTLVREMWSRTSSSKIITIYVFTAITLLIYFFGSEKKKRIKDDETLTLLQIEGDKIGENTAAETDGNIFNSSFDVDETRFEGEFYVQNSPEKARNKKIITASVKFSAENCREWFYIEKKTAWRDSGILSILPPSEANATQTLDGKYDYEYSNYKFFNGFIEGEEIINDLSVNYGGVHTKITFQDQQFTMECRKTVTADEYDAQDKGTRFLQGLNLRAKKYYQRFRALDQNKLNL